LNQIKIKEANINKIHWDWLSANPEAIHLLEANQNKIHWINLSANPAIFYDNEYVLK
jgi:hypothetical protein